MELLRLFTALRRRKWLVLQAIAFFAVAGLVLATVLPRNYESSARVLVSGSESSMSILSELGLGEMAASLNAQTDAIQNKISLSTTRPAIEEVIWRLQLRDGDGRLYTYEEVLVEGLTGEIEARPHLEVKQQQGTDLLVFAARADDPELARLMAQTLVRVAVQQSQSRAGADTRSARVFIEDQLTVVQRDFELALDDIADAQAAEEVIDLESEMKAAISRLSGLMMSFEENAAGIRQVRGRLAEAQAYQARESAGQISPVTSGMNAKVAMLQGRILDLREQRATELTTKTEQHPDLAKVDELILLAESELETALAEQHAMDPTVQQLNAELAGLVERGQELSASIDRTTEQFSSYPDKMRRMSQLKLASVAAENIYKSLQEQRYQIAVAEALLVSDLQLVESATRPERHSSPKHLVNLILGLVVGTLFGVGLAFLFEYVDDTVKTPEDLARTWEVPRLGVVPRFKLPGDRYIIDSVSPTDPVSESYRTIRNGLVYASLDKPLGLVGVTSAAPGEGKSTFCTNLAISFAREGKRVLMVDCDLRRPTLHRAFPSTSNHVGLTGVLTGDVELIEAIQPTPVEGLSVLASGPIPQDPARLVESLRLRQALLDLGRGYDMVLVDTPPVLVVNDAMVIARAVDAMVVVVESMVTTRKMVTDLRGRFESAGMEPVGLVLNKMDFHAAGYGHYLRVYRSYQGGADEEASA